MEDEATRPFVPEGYNFPPETARLFARSKRQASTAFAISDRTCSVSFVCSAQVEISQTWPSLKAQDATAIRTTGSAAHRARADISATALHSENDQNEAACTALSTVP